MDVIIVLIVVLVSLVIAYVLAIRQISQHTFQCKHCLKDFKVKWSRLLFVTHADNEYNIECPHCGKKGCMELAFDKDNTK